MRILALTNRYPRPGREQDAVYNHLQVRALAREHAVAAVVPVPWTERVANRRAGVTIPPELDRDGVHVYHPTYYYPPWVLQSAYGRFYQASVRRTFRRAAAALRPKVVLACWAHPDGWAAVRLGREFGLPVVIKVIGSDVLVLGRAGRRAAKIAEALREADGVVAVSRDLADHVVRLGADPGRVHVVPEGTDLEAFRPGDRGEARTRLGLPADGRVIVFVGNVLLSKGAGVLVEACGGLAARGVEFRCYVVGRGADDAAVRRSVERLGLADRVTLTGPRPQGDLPDWYRAADVVSLPSYSEGIPNVLREALACGRPFVATRVGGIPELVRGPAGRLVPPGDPAALADALAAVLADPPPVTQAERAVNVSWAESARLLAEHLEAAVARRTRG
jgi:glycosyltransferase involved in cell wall biosynthesis